jgi:hypothetical protein
MSANLKDKGKEKRKFARYDYNLPLMILRKTKDKGHPLERNVISHGRLCNYSMGGLYIESDQAFPEGTRLSIRITGAESHGRSDYEVDVRWCKTILRPKGYSYGLGVEYTQPSQKGIFGFSYYSIEIVEKSYGGKIRSLDS